MAMRLTMTSVASLSGLAHGSIVPTNDGSDMAQAANVRSVHGCISAELIPLQPPSPALGTSHRISDSETLLLRF